ncbi:MULTISPECIES: tRNA-uridine aminocarboxypropyltransferase [Vibrio]|uniref:tRNA-uridine aminocarboxypropyltransferase n=1 Tax=Vibrio algicola TaxID=2662262 RepID=A0A5Q0TH63_9VIBR|nr:MULTISPECIES: DTW domain-containing protein [Vibrio]MBD1575518.1 DTW domain-containing protein [Vibrio sp. S11_S32]
MSRYCLQCGKAKLACICQWITPIFAQTQLVILQHPSETKRPMGSAKILTLSLKDCLCFVGEDFSKHPQLNTLLSEPNVNTAVLYPSDSSLAIEDWLLLLGQSRMLSKQDKQSPAQMTGTEQSVTKQRLILLDGTWKKAYKMWQLSSNLHHLTKVQLSADVMGNYRIRKAPSSQHLSTLEAGCYALQVLEPYIDFSSLIYCFEKMVDFHIAQMPDGVFERNYLNK